MPIKNSRSTKTPKLLLISHSTYIRILLVSINPSFQQNMTLHQFCDSSLTLQFECKKGLENKLLSEANQFQSSSIFDYMTRLKIHTLLVKSSNNKQISL